MKLEDQFCKRKQAIKLKSFGVINKCTIDDPEGMKDEKGNVYQVADVGCFYSINERRGFILGEQEDAPYKSDSPIKHYSVAELGMMLNDKSYNVYMGSGKKWRADIEHTTVDKAERNYGTGTTHYQTVHDTEAEARAAMLIYLLENRIITAEEANNRLK